jgi:hypothetical protein
MLVGCPVLRAWYVRNILSCWPLYFLSSKPFSWHEAAETNGRLVNAIGRKTVISSFAESNTCSTTLPPRRQPTEKE